MNKLLELIRPINTNDQIRLGRDNDGGYIVNVRALENSRLISLGINDDWSFEKDFLKFSTFGIVMFDGSISKKIFLNNFLDHLIYFFSIKFIFKSLTSNFFIQHLKNTVSNFVIYSRFLKFTNNPNIEFISKFVSDQNDSINLDTIFKKYTNDNVFLKIDIEGHEYRIFEDILKNKDLINGMVVEFHDIDLLYNLFENIIIELKKYFYITHIHANNYSQFSNKINNLPVYEITFLNKKLHSEIPVFFENGVYNKVNLDQSCYPGKEDYVIQY